jgi:mono/diheme cytochrome c family protein
MGRRITALAAIVWLGTTLVSAQTSAWKLPASAPDEKNPITMDAAALVEGRRLFRENCARCHGPQAKGNGSDADSKHRHHMDLTRADFEDSEGVVFHKVWSGRVKPKMPAFKDKLTKEQVWTLVGYVQSLRAKS